MEKMTYMHTHIHTYIQVHVESMMKPDEHEKAKTLKLVCYNNLAQVSSFICNVYVHIHNTHLCACICVSYSQNAQTCVLQ